MLIFAAVLNPKQSPKNVGTLSYQSSIALSRADAAEPSQLSFVLHQLWMQPFLQWFLNVVENNFHTLILKHLEENYS